MERVGSTWEARVELPPDAYVEYGFLRDGRSVADPLNTARVENGVGGWNQRFWMPAARRRAIELTRRRVPHGEVTRGVIDLRWLAAPPYRRRLALYLPPGAAGDARARRELPLLLVLDGLDYLRRGRLARLLDALITDGRMAPVAAAFLDNAGAGRASEYVANDFTLASLADVVVPAAAERLGLAPRDRPTAPGRTTILGSSMGGLMALHAGTRRPDVFGRVIAQSTSALLDELVVAEESVPAVRLTLLALIEATEAPPIRLWLDVGDLEGLAEPNDRLAAMLVRRGFDLTYRRFPGGHDQTSWAESLVDALPATFPPAAPEG
jgi:enterochelin esterase family protein